MKTKIKTPVFAETFSTIYENFEEFFSKAGLENFNLIIWGENGRCSIKKVIGATKVFSRERKDYLLHTINYSIPTEKTMTPDEEIKYRLTSGGIDFILFSEIAKYGFSIVGEELIDKDS